MYKEAHQEKYTCEQMEKALVDINEGTSVKKAAAKWSIPRTTLNGIKLGR